MFDVGWVCRIAGAIVFASLVLGIQSGTAQDANEAPATPSVPDHAAAVEPARVAQAWLDHGFSDAQRKTLRAACQRGVERRFVPGGTLLIIHRGEVIFREGFGVASLETGDPFPVDAPCRIASVTKPHTATLMALLVAEGKVNWDDSIDRYLPAFDKVTVRGRGAATRPPKVRELLSHTAGFAGQAAIERGAWQIKTDGTLQDAAQNLAEQGLASEPGTVYAYTGLGYLVAGAIIEKVTGQGFAEAMQHRLLEPIGARTATFQPSDDQRARMPPMYERKNGELQRVDMASRRAAMGDLPSPGGGLIATVDDVAALLMLHRNQGKVGDATLIESEQLTPLYRPQPATGKVGYGLGFNIMRMNGSGTAARIRHTGASGTFASLDFDRDLIVVLLTQVPQQQTQPFRDGVLDALESLF